MRNAVIVNIFGFDRERGETRVSYMDLATSFLATMPIVESIPNASWSTYLLTEIRNRLTATDLGPDRTEQDIVDLVARSTVLLMSERYTEAELDDFHGIIVQAAERFAVHPFKDNQIDLYEQALVATRAHWTTSPGTFHAQPVQS